MRRHDHGMARPSAAALGGGVADLAGGVVGLTLGALLGGAHAVRRIVEGLAWGTPGYCGAASGCSCGCCVVHHHYRYECVPPCTGCPCC
jgi:hypothetical protein